MAAVQPGVGNFGAHVYDKTYEASASLGKITGIWYAGTGIFFSIVMVIIGIVLIVKRNPRQVIDAVIKQADCKQITQMENNKSKIINNCVLDVSFIALDGKTYEGKISSDDKMYMTGETLKISYLESNPNDMRKHVIRMRTVGYILLGVGILGMISGGFSLYLTLNYKLYQAATGLGFATGTAVNTYGTVIGNDN